MSKHIVVTPSVCGGKTRIAVRRITVQNIAIWHQRMGWSVDEIANEYDLSPAEIEAALAFFFDNRPAIDASIDQDREFIESMKKQTPSKLAQKL